MTEPENNRILLPDKPAVIEALESLVVRAGQTVRIFSEDLDRTLFDSQTLCTGLSALARKNPHTKVRVLVKQTGALTKHGHVLIDLYRRIPTLVPIRKLTYNPESFSLNYVLSDDCGVLMLQNEEGQPDYVNFYDRPLVARLSTEFDELWEKCQDDKELRQVCV